MIENDAKNRTCWRTYDAQGGRQLTRHCLASECMAWRWSLKLNSLLGISQKDEAHGFCGPAGVPENVL